jgi:hypothetical protein
MRSLRKYTESANRKRERGKAPALFVRLTPELQVNIVAADFFEQQQAEPFAKLVEHVLRAAMQRKAGAA